mmetsp:Transcript_28009/g.32651  ORF Transcript_28009/g.32651 Transcript_28009/m.32651 type:complete len:798 (+) Transcript_28009:25-2418(+)
MIMKKLNAFHFHSTHIQLLLFLLFILPFNNNRNNVEGAATIDTFPKSMQSQLGGNLFSANDDISALQSIDGISFVNVIPLSTKHKYWGKFVLKIPNEVNVADVTGFEFQFRVQLSTEIGEIYIFKIRNYESRRWEKIKSTKQIRWSTQWKVLSKSKDINNLNAYLKNGKMTIQLVSKSDNDTLTIDYFRVGLVGASTTNDFITLDKTNYVSGEDITVAYQSTNQGSTWSWVAIYPASADETALPSPSTMWLWASSCTSNQGSFCSGSLVFNANSDHGGQSWPLCDGEWRAHFINDQESPYDTVLTSDAFFVSGGGGDCLLGSCTTATSASSSKTHKLPVNGDIVSNIAFSSCYHPDNQDSNALWYHMRNTFQADLWNWLGDNIYADGTSMEYKRTQYNAAKEDQYYSNEGPIGEPKIAVTGTWDDHDFGANNQGDDYTCAMPSQNEFVSFFDIPASDPRHFAQGDNQRKGVYSSYTFLKSNNSGVGGIGIHLINLDARTHRSPTFPFNGSCQLGESTMLGEEQWTWLEAQLQVDSEIKVIGSGTQILPPTDQQSRNVNEYCAYDGSDGSFEQSIADVGEGPVWRGTSYESWGEIPQDRTKLLQICQKSINDGYTKKIIFISGDQHWGEIMAKKMPSSDLYGSSQMLYEVTASGIDQNWIEDIENSNRVRVRSSSDNAGSGDLYDNECNFPFIYQGVKHDQCTNVAHTQEWCSTQTDGSDNHISDRWGNCDDEANELVARDKIAYSGENICTDNYMHVCSAKANYGGISVDWDKHEVRLSIYTPHENTAEAAAIVIDF